MVKGYGLEAHNCFLEFRKGLWQTDGALASFPLTAFLHQLYAFKTLHNAALGTDGTTGRLETRMLGHDILQRIGNFRRAEDVDSFQICNKLFRANEVPLKFATAFRGYTVF
jgi:hypothetical protein